MSSITVLKRNKWGIWKDVIFALLAREMRTGFNDKFGLSWAVINPLAFIFILSFVRSQISGPETHTLPTFTFMAVGVLVIQSFLQTFSSAATSIRKNKSLFAFRQVQPISAVIAATFFESLVKLFTLLGVILIMYLFGLPIFVNNALLFLGCFASILLLAFALGLLFGIAELFVVEVRKIRELMVRPLFFISGTFFSLQDIPQEYWHYLTWNPILHAIELSRFSLLSSYGQFGVSLNFLFISVLSLIFASLSIYAISWKQAISR